LVLLEQLAGAIAGELAMPQIVARELEIVEGEDDVRDDVDHGLAVLPVGDAAVGLAMRRLESRAETETLWQWVRDA